LAVFLPTDSWQIIKHAVLIKGKVTIIFVILEARINNFAINTQLGKKGCQFHTIIANYFYFKTN